MRRGLLVVALMVLMCEGGFLIGWWLGGLVP